MTQPAGPKGSDTLPFTYDHMGDKLAVSLSLDSQYRVRLVPTDGYPTGKRGNGVVVNDASYAGRGIDSQDGSLSLLMNSPDGYGVGARVCGAKKSLLVRVGFDLPFRSLRLRRPFSWQVAAFALPTRTPGRRQLIFPFLHYQQSI